MIPWGLAGVLGASVLSPPPWLGCGVHIGRADVVTGSGVISSAVSDLLLPLSANIPGEMIRGSGGLSKCGVGALLSGGASAEEKAAWRPVPISLSLGSECSRVPLPRLLPAHPRVVAPGGGFFSSPGGCLLAMLVTEEGDQAAVR